MSSAPKPRSASLWVIVPAAILLTLVGAALGAFWVGHFNPSQTAPPVPSQLDAKAELTGLQTAVTNAAGACDNGFFATTDAMKGDAPSKTLDVGMQARQVCADKWGTARLIPLTNVVAEPGRSKVNSLLELCAEAYIHQKDELVAGHRVRERR